MSITTINVGTIANDSTGDDLRQAFVKVNNNFSALDARVVPQNDAANLGVGTGVFYAKDGATLNFRSLIAGDNVALTSDGTSITISSPSTLSIAADSTALSISGANRQFGIKGGQNITTVVSATDISVAVNPTNLILQDTSPTLGAALNASTFNINNVGTLTATTVAGTTITGALTGTVDGVNVTNLNRIVTSADYGDTGGNATSGLELLFRATTIGYGTITSPAAIVSDYGTL
tara:strand:+ start:932 stop:1633 length:702 start_codon:yes stop_codon:yes gene_type:complete